MEDPDDDVRDWALFGLGVQGDQDAPEIRDALFCRLSDTSEDVREEALVGLSKRRDARIVPTLIHALEQPSVSRRVIEAAYTLLGYEEDQKNWSTKDYARVLQQQFSD